MLKRSWSYIFSPTPRRFQSSLQPTLTFSHSHLYTWHFINKPDKRPLENNLTEVMTHFKNWKQTVDVCSGSSLYSVGVLLLAFRTNETHDIFVFCWNVSKGISTQTLAHMWVLSRSLTVCWIQRVFYPKEGLEQMYSRTQILTAWSIYGIHSQRLLESNKILVLLRHRNINVIWIISVWTLIAFHSF